MSNDITQILSQPETKKAIKYNLIAAISDDMTQGYSALKTTIAGGGNKDQQHWKGTKSNEILSKNQITPEGEKRWNQWIEKRK